jgi:two-component system, cell cycle sensor histidine kinase and response regulator CckA
VAKTDSKMGGFDAPIDRTDPPGNIKAVLALAGSLVGAALGLTFVGGESAGFYILIFLAVLAAIGIFALFAIAIGILRFGTRRKDNDFARILLGAAEEGLIVSASDGEIVFVNRAYLTLTGVDDPAHVRSVERIFASDPDVAEAIYRLSQAAREGKRLQEEFRVGSGPRGVPAWFRIRVRPLDQDGWKKPLSVWTVVDVSRERERQENVFQELQHAIDYLDHAPAGFFSAETDGTIGYMNATLADWLGHDLGQVGAGALKLSDVFAGDGASLLSTLAGAGGTVKTEALDLDLKTRSGQSFPVRILHKVAYAPDGTRGPSKTLVLDRSRARGVHDPLRDAQVEFARFFNTTPIAIATVDKSGRVKRANASFARLFGEAMKGENREILSAVAEAGRSSLGEALKRAVAGQSDIKPVEGLVDGDGGASVRFYFSSMEAARDEDDADGEAAILYALDTTEQRALEGQVIQAQKMEMVGQLAGGIAHDFNNVLTAIIGHADLLLLSHKQTDPSFRDIMQIKHNANRAAGLVKHLLAFSRRQTLRPQVLALGDVLTDLRMMLARLLGEKVDLDVNHGRDLWLVKVDNSQFEQVVVNLVVNARDAMPEGGKVTIRTRNVAANEVAQFAKPLLPAVDWILVEVEDTGTGIPEHIREKIFEPFFSTKEVGKGTGLGLSTVYGIVKQTEGFIFCDSTVGRGTVFRIFLPRHHAVAEAEAPAAKAAAEAPPAKDMTGQGTVLLVEDEDAVRSFATRALESRGYSVLSANSGVEALSLIDEKAGGIDLVVSDVVMPEMDGPTLLKELRKRNPAIKIIFVSGYAEDAFKKNLAEDETFAFLPKPFALKDLVQAVKDTMPG